MKKPAESSEPTPSFRDESTVIGSGEVAMGRVVDVEAIHVDDADRYMLGERLGRGGMGDVVACLDRRIGRTVALKKLRVDPALTQEQVRRFVREVRIQGQLEHPSIVPVYDVRADADGNPEFTMRRVRGRTLRSVLDAQHAGDQVEEFSFRRLLSVFAQVTLAIAYAHARGVVHRDIKPSNIMLGAFGEVYVLDWGVAKLAGGADEAHTTEQVKVSDQGLTTAGSLIGTVGYMAPEQIVLAYPPVDERADVYALGVVLFELLSGERLHPGDTEQRVKSTLTGADVRARLAASDREIAPELEAICRRALSLNREDRYPTAAEMHKELERYLEDDRDLSRRRELAFEHAGRARDEASKARAGGSEAVAARRRALREAGRALSLDPSHEAGSEVLLELLTDPPTTVPDEVLAELEEFRAARVRSMGKLGSMGFAVLLAYIPLLLWMGVRNWLGIGVIFGSLLVFAAISAYSARSARPVRTLLLVAMANAFTVGTTSLVLGPFMVVPGFVSVNIAAFILIASWRRWVFTVLGLSAVFVPLALQVVGVLPRMYSFDASGMHVAPFVVSLQSAPTLVFLSLTALSTVVVTVLIMGKITEDLGHAELQLRMNAWQLKNAIATGVDRA